MSLPRSPSFQRVGLFGSLPGETIARLAERMEREEVPAGTAIVTEGEKTLSGSTSCSRASPGVTQAGRGARAVIRPGETSARWAR